MAIKLPSMRSFRSFSAIPLFANKPSHPFNPLRRDIAVARIAGQGRPRAGKALPLTGESTAAPWPKRAKRAILAVTILGLILPLSGSSAARLTPRHRHAASPSFAGRIANYVADAAQRFAIPTSWIYAVMHVESQGARHAVSSKGAMGLMQIMPQTWADLRARYGLGPDPFEPHDNILAGTAYLREMHDRYGSPGDLAAYNAGPARYEDYRDRHRPLPPETTAYVAKLAPAIGAEPLREARNDDPVAQFFKAAAALFAAPAQAQSLIVQPVAQTQSRRGTLEAPVRDLTAITPRSTGLFIRLSSREQAR
jgi:soluble lytic murein transglycosylase-like protein